MNIYSIEEIVKATNNILLSKTESRTKKNIQISKEEIPINIQNIISEAENTLVIKNNKNIQTPLVLRNEIPVNNKTNSFSYNIKIKPKFKDHMVNELYTFLKKKIKKNTLKLIIDQQLEIKNFKNKIISLKYKEKTLVANYQALKNNYELVLENNKILNIDNDNLINNLNNITENKKYLEEENKKLKLNLGELQKHNKILNIDNNNLSNNFDSVAITNEKLDNENKQFKINLNENKLNLQESLIKIRSFEVNNSELKKTISRYIINYKKLQEKINLIENSKNLKSEDDVNKVKFYQDENIRLSSELLLARKKNETIKLNLDNIELEKQKISNKIKELNNAITGKSNIISSPIIKEISTLEQKDIKNLNNTEQKSLDEVINKIFSKI